MSEKRQFTITVFFAYPELECLVWEYVIEFCGTPPHCGPGADQVMKHNWLIDSLCQQTGFDRSEVRLILASHHLAVTVKEVIRQLACSN